MFRENDPDESNTMENWTSRVKKKRDDREIPKRVLNLQTCVRLMCLFSCRPMRGWWVHPFLTIATQDSDHCQGEPSCISDHCKDGGFTHPSPLQHKILTFLATATPFNTTRGMWKNQKTNTKLWNNAMGYIRQEQLEKQTSKSLFRP